MTIYVHTRSPGPAGPYDREVPVRPACAGVVSVAGGRAAGVHLLAIPGQAAVQFWVGAPETAGALTPPDWPRAREAVRFWLRVDRPGNWDPTGADRHLVRGDLEMAVATLQQYLYWIVNTWPELDYTLTSDGPMAGAVGPLVTLTAFWTVVVGDQHYRGVAPGRAVALSEADCRLLPPLIDALQRTAALLIFYAEVEHEARRRTYGGGPGRRSLSPIDQARRLQVIYRALQRASAPGEALRLAALELGITEKSLREWIRDLLRQSLQLPWSEDQVTPHNVIRLINHVL